jgi:hypothetical protein
MTEPVILDQSVTVLTVCTNAEIADFANLITYISAIGLVGLLTIVPFRSRFINSAETPEKKLQMAIGLNYAARGSAASVAVTFILWFLSPIFTPANISACLSPL